eukprot:8708273-Alexandrium_andersonii.AAC.1
MVRTWGWPPLFFWQGPRVLRAGKTVCERSLPCISSGRGQSGGSSGRPRGASRRHWGGAMGNSKCRFVGIRTCS